MGNCILCSKLCKKCTKFSEKSKIKIYFFYNYKERRGSDPVIIEGPIKAFLNEVETTIFVLRSENKIGCSGEKNI